MLGEDTVTSATRPRQKPVQISVERLHAKCRQLAPHVLAGREGAAEELAVVEQRLADLSRQSELTRLAAEQADIEQREAQREQEASQRKQRRAELADLGDRQAKIAREIEERLVDVARLRRELDALRIKSSAVCAELGVAAPDGKRRIVRVRVALALGLPIDFELRGLAEQLGNRPLDAILTDLFARAIANAEAREHPPAPVPKPLTKAQLVEGKVGRLELRGDDAVVLDGYDLVRFRARTAEGVRRIAESRGWSIEEASRD